MAIMVECQMCHRKHAIKNKVCPCGQDLDKAKRSKNVKYWISFRLPGGVQRRELVGTSHREAQAADGKRRGQKREGRIFDMLPDSRLTFGELTDWYLELPTVKALASHARIKIALKNFDTIFGHRVAGTVLPVELEEYQATRTADGLASTTIDLELAIVRGLVSTAFDNSKIDGSILKAFRRVKNLSRRSENARKRTVTIIEYLRIIEAGPAFLRGMLIVAMNTGMRPGEIRLLRWSYIDRQSGFIRLPAAATKEGYEKAIPINHHVKAVLEGQIRRFYHDYVFACGTEPIVGLGAIKTALGGACMRAGVSYGRKTENGLTMHDFRRTVKTNMLAAGVDKTYRDLIFGHSLQGMDRVYIKPSEDTLRQAMAVYTAWLDGQLAIAEQVAQVAPRVM